MHVFGTTLYGVQTIYRSWDIKRCLSFVMLEAKTPAGYVHTLCFLSISPPRLTVWYLAPMMGSEFPGTAS